ncbi:MAG: chorismate-binding protein [Candidatus Omnitrophota bacterium]
MQVLCEFENNPHYFKHPREIITCLDPLELPAYFDRLERAVADGYYAAGFLSYEAGHALVPGVKPLPGNGFPLMQMGVFTSFSRQRPADPRGSFRVEGLAPSLSREAYTNGINAIHDHIRAGDVYQITYCLPWLFSFKGSSYSLYRELLRRQPVPYPAYIETDRYRILSLSPEMFFKKTGERIAVKPMKGSWPRESCRDILGGILLHYDSKNRAENVMIADLLRNDLGRIGDMVRVPKLFEVAGYRTIFQMTSTVTARVQADIPLVNIFRALFPSGSVTGAPKVKAMGIIQDLEPAPRRIYTGGIGWITPRRDFFFNVPIRTILLDGAAGEMGVGGGIVSDSTPEGEWAEILWKSRFLRGLA